MKRIKLVVILLIVIIFVVDVIQSSKDEIEQLIEEIEQRYPKRDSDGDDKQIVEELKDKFTSKFFQNVDKNRARQQQHQQQGKRHHPRDDDDPSMELFMKLRDTIMNRQQNPSGEDMDRTRQAFEAQAKRPHRFSQQNGHRPPPHQDLEAKAERHMHGNQNLPFWDFHKDKIRHQHAKDKVDEIHDDDDVVEKQASPELGVVGQQDSQFQALEEHEQSILT
ncbi:hypothetical protein SAMD00019534_105300 [Acytostelium subglobosum LB1]|uniref:hypothetical protein n=1 Tax=Acytostelium subglobosum LB1 TaxID=1410327 RepID=UPI000644E61E|nr:hypothetical protein SAMD00019534_105300 [Acytostelium subglobosum LB1]GAM27355.1 hypothetical protein SAMD00019534_105300 [Acytostelium subglobosum LB1]|eukprot:XP_012749822.1 hypothetical protein SAMD00019534_105300 [Acytostelium subglobosum LB1]